MMTSYEVVALAEEAHIGQARRVLRRIAVDVGFSDRQMAEIEIAMKEIGSNAIKFAGGTGQAFIGRTNEEVEPRGIEINYVDKGRGIEDTATAIEDGYTTSGSMGTGLGAIKRMADEFYIHSSVRSNSQRLPVYGRTTNGTAIVFRKFLSGSERAAEPARARWGHISRAAVGQEENGDAYTIKQVGDRLILAMIDGLGHGLGARDSAREAVASIEANSSRPVEAILRAAHEALRSMRGAVIGLAAVDTVTGAIEYAGVGNTDFRVFGGRAPLRFISMNGTVGSRMDRVKVFNEKLPRVATVVMSTDGISERWDVESYPGLLGLHPQLLCAVVMRDYSRPNDDATILCGRLSF